MKTERLEMRFLRRQNQLRHGFGSHGNQIKLATGGNRECLNILKGGDVIRFIFLHDCSHCLVINKLTGSRLKARKPVGWFLQSLGRTW